jgi:tRNA pseudouridine38-40 synthase
VNDPWKYQYLIRLSYLGFRYSGWQIQPGQKTVEGMLVKTLKYVLGDQPFKTLASGRTDAKVSSLSGACSLWLTQPLSGEISYWIEWINRNTPQDLKVESITEVPIDFNPIKNVVHKTYGYLFCCGDKPHPFTAPFMAHFSGDLDLNLMKKGAELYLGTHDFTHFTVRTAQKPNQSTQRTIDSCSLMNNDRWTANFFPSSSYIFWVTGHGFIRYQIRLMMGALVQLGRGEISMSDLSNALQGVPLPIPQYAAPGSGLGVYEINY